MFMSHWIGLKGWSLFIFHLIKQAENGNCKCTRNAKYFSGVFVSRSWQFFHNLIPVTLSLTWDFLNNNFSFVLLVSFVSLVQFFFFLVYYIHRYDSRALISLTAHCVRIFYLSWANFTYNQSLPSSCYSLDCSCHLVWVCGQKCARSSCVDGMESNFKCIKNLPITEIITFVLSTTLTFYLVRCSCCCCWRSCCVKKIYQVKVFE